MVEKEKLYHMDAFIGINNLHLTAMRGTYCYGGFPEIAYGKYSDMILNKSNPLK
jgi:DNA mismatch repair protein MSH6